MSICQADVSKTDMLILIREFYGLYGYVFQQKKQYAFFAYCFQKCLFAFMFAQDKLFSFHLKWILIYYYFLSLDGYMFLE